MSKLFASDKIYIKESTIPNAGRGVYARRDIKKGEVIEQCPVIEILEADAANIGGSILVTYFFYLGIKKNRVFLALGFGSIYNHSYEENAAYTFKEKEIILEFTALKDIKKDEEITFNYSNGTPHDKIPLWFTVE